LDETSQAEESQSGSAWLWNRLQRCDARGDVGDERTAIDGKLNEDIEEAVDAEVASGACDRGLTGAGLRWVQHQLERVSSGIAGEIERVELSAKRPELAVAGAAKHREGDRSGKSGRSEQRPDVHAIKGKHVSVYRDRGIDVLVSTVERVRYVREGRSIGVLQAGALNHVGEADGRPHVLATGWWQSGGLG